MIIICLDQCAISDLALNVHKDCALRELRDLLRRGARDMELIAPVATETVAETTGCSLTERQAIHELHCELADSRLGGPVWAFKPMWQMIEEETLALARLTPSPTSFQMANWHSVEKDELAQRTWKRIVAGKQMMTERVRSVPLVEMGENPSFNKARDGIILEHASHVYRQLIRLLNSEQPDPHDHMGYRLACYLQEAGITEEELKRLIEDVRHHRWRVDSGNFQSHSTGRADRN